MQPLHDLYCDENHMPRQACNDALAPADVRARRSATPEPVAPEPAPSAPDEEPPLPSAVREAIAIAEMAPPTPYVTREWERTAAAVAGMSDADADPAREEGARRDGIIAWFAIIGLATASVWMFVRALRGRSSGDCSSCD